jgi:hypothetical protein
MLLNYIVASVLVSLYYWATLINIKGKSRMNFRLIMLRYESHQATA